MASASMALALSVPVHAQGHGNGNGNGGNSQGHKSTPPSSLPLFNPSTGVASAAVPAAWLDDASLLAPGTAALTLGLNRWAGADLSEVDVPIVSAGIGLAPRFQIGASVPRVVGSADSTGPVGGIGTTDISGKIALLTGTDGVKLAVSPVLQILGTGAVQTLAPAQSRMEVGLPVSLEVAQGPARIFASAGVFSGGAWFAGGGTAMQATPRVGLSIAFTRAWANDSTTGIMGDRREVSGSVSYFVRPQIAVYGSIGQTIATTDANGAGTTVGAGVTFLVRTHITH
jgi:hypothetical protein